MANVVARLRGGAIWGAIARGITGVLVIISGGLLARTLSAEHLGYFFFILPLVRCGGIVVGFGTPTGILKDIGIAAEQRHWDAVRRIVLLTLLALSLAGVAVAMLFAGLWPILSEKVFDHQIPLLLGGVIFVLAVLNAVEQAGSAFFRAVRQTILGLFLLGVPRELLFVVGLATMLITAGTIGIATALWLFLGAALVVTAGIAVLLVRFLATHRQAREKVEPQRHKAFFALCFPIMLYGSTVFLLGRADIWTLGVFRTPEEVAVYGAVVRLTALISFVLQVLNLVLPPMVATAYHKGQIRKLALLARTAASWSSLLAICVVSVLLLFGGWLLGAVYGPGFEAGWSILAILTIGQGINAACGSPGVILQMTGFHKLLMQITIGIACLNLIGNIIVVREYGPLGAAAVTAATLILQNVAMTYYTYEKVGVLSLPSPRMFSRRYLTRLVTGSSR